MDLCSTIKSLLSSKSVPAGYREFFHLSDRVGNLKMLMQGLLASAFTGIYDFGHSYYYATEVEHCAHWIKTKRDSPVSIVVFRVPQFVFSPFRGLKIENTEVALWMDLVKSYFRGDPSPFQVDYVDGPCCANPVQVSKGEKPQHLKASDDVILRQLAIRSAVLQSYFFEKAKVYVINLPYRLSQASTAP